jgi:hypothetical protein
MTGKESICSVRYVQRLGSNSDDQWVSEQQPRLAIATLLVARLHPSTPGFGTNRTGVTLSSAAISRPVAPPARSTLSRFDLHRLQKLVELRLLGPEPLHAQ